MYTCTVTVCTHFAHSSNSLTLVMFLPCTFLSNVLSMHIPFIINHWTCFVYTCTVNGFCVRLSASKSNLSWAAHKNPRSACYLKSGRTWSLIKASLSDCQSTCTWEVSSSEVQWAWSLTCLTQKFLTSLFKNSWDG